MVFDAADGDATTCTTPLSADSSVAGSSPRASESIILIFSYDEKITHEKEKAILSPTVPKISSYFFAYNTRGCF